MALNADLLRTSLALVVERQPQITPRFYEILFSRYPQAQPLFGRNRPEVQQKMLQDAIVAVVDHVEDAAWLKEQLHAMGVRHKDYQVTPEMFGWVGECLLATLAEIAGPQWSPEIAQAWTEAYGAITGLMLEGYRSLRPRRWASTPASVKRGVSGCFTDGVRQTHEFMPRWCAEKRGERREKAGG